MALYKGTTKYYIGAKGKSEIPESIYNGARTLSMGQTIPAGTYIPDNLLVEGDADLESANIVKNTSIFGTSGSYANGCPNGQEWSFIPTPFKPGALHYANGLYVAGDLYDQGLWYSTDGENWYQSNVTTGNYLGTIIYENGYWLAVSSNTEISYISTDGRTWSSTNTGGAIGVASNGSTAVIARFWSGNGVYYLPLDGTTTWTQSSLTSGVDNVFYEGGYFITTIAGVNSGQTSYYSIDGVTWNDIGLQVSSIYYYKGYWYAYQFTSKNIYRTDRIESGNWTLYCTLPISAYAPSIFRFDDSDRLVCCVGNNIYFIKNGNIIQTINNLEGYDYYQISDNLYFIITYDKQSVLINTQTNELTTINISYNYAMGDNSMQVKTIQRIGDDLFALNPDGNGFAISPIWEPDIESATSGSYLIFKGNEDFTLKTQNEIVNWDGVLQYSTNLQRWKIWNGTEISSGDKVLYLRGTGNSIITGSGSNKQWVFSGSDSLEINTRGNIEYLLDYETVENGEHPAMADYCYYNMFYNCTSLTTAPELPATTLAPHCYYQMFYGCTSLTTPLELPATILTKNCYGNMFYNCTSLTTAPKLPATTLADYCYYNMFYNCTSLATPPELPATTLAEDCYSHMFNNCTSLTTAPELPVTTLADYCYAGMFRNCTSLVTPPKLPAISLAQGCYWGMFEGCTSLTTAPELPATTLAGYCYYDMFYNCTSLTTAPELPATTLANSCYRYMFYNCTSLTTAPELPATTLASYCYRYMFSFCTSLTIAPELPATTLAYECYAYMFSNCRSLTISPKLSAATLAGYCCSHMFEGCTSLTTAPELPATTLAIYCYEYMFAGCTSLIAAPKLPATTLAGYCYEYMFYYCTSLTTAPELPATTLDEWCYNRMFSSCTSLTTAPELPATTLADYCYNRMFSDCTSLTTAPELPATTLDEWCYSYMFSGCTSLNIYSTATGNATYAWLAPASTYTNYMFQSTNLDGSTFPNKGTPTEGTTYYWAISN